MNKPMKSVYMLRRLVIIFLALTLSCTTIACGSNTENQSQQKQEQVSPQNSSNPQVTNNTAQKALPAGEYPVQQATFNDANGEYTLMLLNTPAGSSPTYRTANLQMARLTEEEVKSKKGAYAKSENGQVSMHMPEDFKIEYVHNVTQTQTNPQTGQKETVVVKQESSFWKPFAASVAGTIAGQAISNMLFRPQYYMPPVYSSGGMMGYGGYGSSYNQAVDSYRSRYNEPPAAVRNRTTLRTTGRLGNFNNNTRTGFGQPNTDRNRSTGAGFGSSTLRQNNRGTNQYRRSNSGFGSSGSRMRSSGGFGSRRR
jgi:hypothetical protein